MNTDRLAEFETRELESGNHDAGGGMCAMEAAAWIAGEPHSDDPKCVCPIIAAFCSTK